MHLDVNDIKMYFTRRKSSRHEEIPSHPTIDLHVENKGILPDARNPLHPIHPPPPSSRCTNYCYFANSPCRRIPHLASTLVVDAPTTATCLPITLEAYKPTTTATLPTTLLAVPIFPTPQPILHSQFNL